MKTRSILATLRSATTALALAATALGGSLNAVFAADSAAPAAATPAPVGVPVHYQLPTDGPLPRTYRVTLAAVDANDPKWVVSNFASGVVRTVTAENGGKFTEIWNGLDDNYMPVPPGSYGIKGIYMPAEKWKIDGEYHSITAKLVGSANTWAQGKDEDGEPNVLVGDPVSSPLRLVDVAPSGIGVIYYQYFENGTNNIMADFNKPPGYKQTIRGFGSGSAAGGFATCTDGETVWSFSTDAGPVFLYRADGKKFGTGSGAGRKNVTNPDGWPTGMAAWKSEAEGRTIVFVAQRGKVVSDRPRHFTESKEEFVDTIVALDGETAEKLAEWKVYRPQSIKVRNGKLYVMRRIEGKDAAKTGADADNAPVMEIAAMPLDAKWKEAKFSKVAEVPSRAKLLGSRPKAADARNRPGSPGATSTVPFDFDVDGSGQLYVSLPADNHIYKLSPKGTKLAAFGKQTEYAEGTYDPQSFLRPERICLWRDAQGKERLLVVEMMGANRLSEWGTDGKLLREWVTSQTASNGGWDADPRHPEFVYMSGPGNTEEFVRWRVNYETGEWKTDAVWHNVGTGFFGGRYNRFEWANPKVHYHGDRRYFSFTSAHKFFIFREEGNRLIPSVALFVEKNEDPKTKKSERSVYLWRDLNGDGAVQEEEFKPFPLTIPQGVIFGRAFGDSWGEDLSLLAIGQSTPFIWKLSPTGFDAHGNPIYDNVDGWKKWITDEIFVDKKANRATATRGGNEVGTSFSSDWSGVTEAPDGGAYVGARSGPNFSANFGTQYKLSRYVPDGKGGLRQQWRVGRITLGTTAAAGQVYGPIFLSAPINGLIGVIDNSRAGVVIYTDEGLYVDTLLPDERLVKPEQRGSYWLPGEYFTGHNYLNRENGRVYLALGKWMATLYEAVGWTDKTTVVKPLTTADKTVQLAASQIGNPPEIALVVRGGAAASKVARYYPAPGGGPAIDASMSGWEACDAVKFTDGQGQNVEARCLYDPEHLYIRWEVEMKHAISVKPLLPVEHLFAHDRATETLGLYLQCDPAAQPGGKFASGRPGDVRLTFAIVKDDTQPGSPERVVVLGMYPKWAQNLGEKPTPVTYNTAQSTPFEHVGLVPGVKSAYKISDDGKRFVIAAAIPRTALPGAPALDGLRTTGNFDVNLGGGNRFWWSNSDGSASRDVYDEPTEARLYPGAWSTIQFLPMETLPIRSWMAIGPFGDARFAALDHAKNGDEIARITWANSYPPDTVRDLAATYEGDMTRTLKGPNKAAWKRVEISRENVEFDPVLKWHGYNNGGAAYLLTHIFSPEPATVNILTNNPHGKIGFVGQLNGKPIPADPQQRNSINRLDPNAPLELKAGWNELVIRFNYFYGTQELGASIKADPAVLWKLRISGPKPE